MSPSRQWTTRKVALQITVAYLLVGLFWILASDRILATFITDPQRLTQIQTYKGWAYVILTGLLLYWLVSNSVSALLKSRTELRQSKLNYRRLVETANDGIAVLDPDGAAVFTNQKLADLLGTTAEKLQRDGYKSFLHSDSKTDWQESLTQTEASKRQQFNCRFINAQGDDLWTIVATSPIRDAEGSFEGSLRLIADTTSLHATQQALSSSLELQRELLDELNHRVRNNLSWIIGLVDVMQDTTDGSPGFATQLRNRLSAIATAHSLLSESRWQPVPVIELLHAHLHEDEKGRVNVSGETDTLMPSTRVGAFMLVLNELFSDCRSRGALSVPTGNLNIAVKRMESSDGASHLHMLWTESGAHQRQAAGPETAGQRLARGMVSGDLHGEMTLRYDDGNARHTLTVELEDTLSQNRRGVSSIS